jgi:argininosuccinate lyase
MAQNTFVPNLTSRLTRGRLAGTMMNERVQSFMSSFNEDALLVGIDIDVGEAHAIGLARAGILSRQDLRKVLRAFEEARRRAPALLRSGRAGRDFHDIHPVIERLVASRAGEEAGGMVHLGKSRNDQVAADIAIFCRRNAADVVGRLGELALALVRLAGTGGIVPAFTHSRAAQAVTVREFAFGHLAALGRDAERLRAAAVRINRSPLGAAAVGGTSVPVDRRLVARLLGFPAVATHPLDATGSRDCVLEFLSALAILQGTLSRLATDIMFLSGDGVGVLEYPDGLADTSSAMPQKKNPDPLELVRARAGSVSGALSGALAIVHGLSSGYSRDLQELKPLLWGAVRTVADSASIMALAVSGVRVRPGAADRVVSRGYAEALDLAEFLSLKKGVPFRRAHFAVGGLVAHLAGTGRGLRDAGAREASDVISRAAGRKVALTAAEYGSAVDPLASATRRSAAATRGSRPGREAPEISLMAARMWKAELSHLRALSSAVRRYSR